MNENNLQKDLENLVKRLEWKLDLATDSKFASIYVDKELNNECGDLHLQWVVDKFWGQITHKVILPNGRKLYEALVVGNHTVENMFDNNNDQYMYYIPTGNNKKVWVHTTQNSDFVYIITEENRNIVQRPRFDIRKIFKEHNSESHFCSDKELIGSINNAIHNADYLIECHDDEYDYSKRHSLEFYRKINFNIPSYENHIYGDGRDGGYVLSYEVESNTDFQKVESAWHHWDLLKYATDILCWASDWINE